ncbi:MAG: DUF362 domain-containing protein [Clostridia bacterium]|nr:DUF362 domain-containing protein [Clostridia bacterium]MBR0510179.1 DUF362 domain-containing protein [Clostridia bacterium]MBR0538138.1 DUF362 domain-containing protein [Clostridia bacterium]
MRTCKPVPGKDGNRYIPFEDRTGDTSVVFFTRDLSAEGLIKIYDRVSSALCGKTAVKLHTGEAEGPNIIPRPWVKELFASRLSDASIIETNTYYEGSRYTTDAHRKTLAINGWTFCPVDITDSAGVASLPVKDGKWFQEMHVGKSMLDYDSLLVLTHFKGHTMGGFGGSNKNIGIGCADGRIGKAEIHTAAGSDNLWSIAEEELMERITESTKATIDFFAPHVCYINTMRNMSVSCDCEGTAAEPVVTPDVGFIASLDILAADNASMDLIYQLPDGGGKALIERVETRHGLRQLSYMKELGMGNDRYILVDIDNGDARITAAEAVKDVRPGWQPDRYNVFWGRNRRV